MSINIQQLKQRMQSRITAAVEKSVDSIAQNIAESITTQVEQAVTELTEGMITDTFQPAVQDSTIDVPGLTEVSKNADLIPLHVMKQHLAQ